MKQIMLLALLLLIVGCRNNNKPKVTVNAPTKSTKAVKEYRKIQYNDAQLESFLDSVGNLLTKPLADKAAFYADSVFKKNQDTISRLIAATDFVKLKRALRVGEISYIMAKLIFGNIKVDSNCNQSGLLDSVKKGNIKLTWYPFNKNKNEFNEFAVCVGDQDDCTGAELFFLKSNKIIAKQDGYSRRIGSPEHLNIEGKTVIYRDIYFDSGSGIWWNNFFFYQYDGDKLIPVLNIPQNINLLQPSPWGFRELWFESFIQKRNTLTLKMVYHLQLPDSVVFENFTTEPNTGPKIVDDSTFVQFSWDEKAKRFKGDFEKSKISEAQVLSYYLEDNELLFINSYYKTLKKAIGNKRKRFWILRYLNEVKNENRK